MDQFLDIALSFPTVVFTVLLAAVLLYWILVALGLLDMDWLDLDFEVDGIDGLDAVDGAGEGLDVDADADVDAEGSSGGPLAVLLRTFGLTGVPLTVSLSLVVLAAWVVTYLTSRTLAATPGADLAVALGLGVLAAAFFVGLLFAAVGVKPLKPVFATHQAASVRSFVGQPCTVTTLTVSDRFGQAEVDDGGAGLLVQIRSRRDDDQAQLVKGARALIFDYDSEEEVFLVTPMTDDPLLAESSR